ncbi:mycothiol system anti-sigma-R factor [Jonesia denitrificans]|uniref:Anti-sigma factor n=1 Tax=Jonesia denitrificans (strain ATCC 14870 / DSM 20603 / BCRC 15368 / CIP 55.134 / JCM 11481 / NBRC 15587 / NCTC 10816 / Prevot 55134) TaxID=471856 RepID=C7QZF4_JONDD|nr:mycothiol system anti-sigma-R factor [Jonesia denitrificans]ACV09452.1 anti-sigma factor [Jonesia denitrificans DSM 20603]ASE09306.1 mycothiol system anti-sigma-R factor [Jonesia denitrificans]QXB43850.1 mycothiol system anti-sigma-R factor [Jonesia denitrificans]SQH21804.1 mycothiol system anti-sigma-R factor [Jonesia denitrificans]
MSEKYSDDINLDTEECQSVVTHIFEYLDSEMTSEDAEKMRHHVAQCSPCLAELSIDDMIKKVLKRSCSQKAPDHLRVRIHAQFTTMRIVEE